MKKQFGRPLRRVFEEKLLKHFAQFERIKDADIPAADRLYEWELNRGFSVYLSLSIHTNKDAFTLEVAWSRQGRYPAYLVGMFPVDIPRCNTKKSSPKDGEFRFRIGNLWPPHEDVWWKISHEPEPDLDDFNMEEIINPKPVHVDLDLIESQVEDVIRRIRDYVVPYFEISAAEQAVDKQSS